MRSAQAITHQAPAATALRAPGHRAQGKRQDGPRTHGTRTGQGAANQAIQARLRATDLLEREADQTAERVLGGPTGGTPGGGCARFRHVTGGAAGVEPHLNPQPTAAAVATGGRPLSGELRHYFEPRFGRDLSWVQVHTGPRAAAAAEAVNARAFTLGRNIVFGTRAFAPGSGEGRRLLAHELTHAVQQRAGLAPTLIQRAVNEAPFPGGGRVESTRQGEWLAWNFAINSGTLTEQHQTGLATLGAQIAALLRDNPEAELDLEGLASRTGTDAINDPLSQTRAETVRDALVGAGVDLARIRLTSVGARESLPAESQEALARSRAVRITLVPTHIAPALGAGTSAPPTATQPAGTQPVPAPGGPGVGGPTLPGTPTATTPARPAAPGPTGTGTAPACRTQVLAYPLTGGTVSFRTVGAQKVLQAGDGTASSLGMQFFVFAQMNPAGCGGTMEFLQNVNTSREMVFKDGSRARQVSSGFVLDTSDPYPTQDLSATLGASPEDVILTTNDSPAQGTGGIGSLAATEARISSLEVRDEFRMFLMLRPTTGARRTLQSADWEFIGQAVNTTSAPGAGTLQVDPGISRILPASGNGSASAAQPVLSPNVTSLSFVVDRAGLSGATDADDFATVLNGTGP